MLLHLYLYIYLSVLASHTQFYELLFIMNQLSIGENLVLKMDFYLDLLFYFGRLSYLYYCLLWV